MRGRTLILGFLGFVAVFLAGLVWTQVFAYYERQKGVDALRMMGEAIPVADYDGIDSASSPLKLRACLTIDPAWIERLGPRGAAGDAAQSPFWFRCFDAGGLTADLASGAARAYDIGRNEPEGFDLMLAVYPDGRAFVWRQLNERDS